MRWRAKVSGSVCQQPTHRKSLMARTIALLTVTIRLIRHDWWNCTTTPRTYQPQLFTSERASFLSRSSCKTLMVCNEGLPSFFCADFPKFDGFSKFSFLFSKLNPPLSPTYRGTINNVGCCCNWIKTAGGTRCSASGSIDQMEWGDIYFAK